jgi:hypothetical protein
MVRICKPNVLSSEGFKVDCEDEKLRKILTVHIYFLVSHVWSKQNKSSVTEIFLVYYRKIFPLKGVYVKFPSTTASN